jgi:transcriptional regulator with XRE-family HTH domain
MKFSGKFRTLRQNAGLKQKELGTALGVSARTIVKYENGQSYPSAEFLPKIAAFFDITIDSLMNEDDEFLATAYEKGGSKGIRGASALIDEVVAMFAGGKLSDDDRDAAMRAIQNAYWIAVEENKKYAPKKYRNKRIAEKAGK